MAKSDQYYIEQCLNGHPDEFRGLVRRYQAVLSAYLAGRLGNKADAEEAVQETFVRAYFGLGQLKKRRSFNCWLLGIAGRVAKEQLRSKKRYRDLSGLAQEAPEPKTSEEYELERAIAELDSSYREVILLRFYAGRSCLQIAERLDMPIGTVTKTLSKAYAKLRQSLQKQKSSKNSEVRK